MGLARTGLVLYVNDLMMNWACALISWEFRLIIQKLQTSQVGAIPNVHIFISLEWQFCLDLHLKNLTWIPKMMVWKMYLQLQIWRHFGYLCEKNSGGYSHCKHCLDPWVFSRCFIDRVEVLTWLLLLLRLSFYAQSLVCVEAKLQSLSLCSYCGIHSLYSTY